MVEPAGLGDARLLQAAKDDVAAPKPRFPLLQRAMDWAVRKMCPEDPQEWTPVGQPLP